MNGDDKESYNDVNSSNSTFEKDSGLSRATDSDPEVLPPPIRSRSQSPNISISVKEEDLNLRRWTSDMSLERELASLHREMEAIRIECDRLISKHNNAEHRVANMIEPILSPISDCKKLFECKIDETSSAYNTGGESSRSTPMKNEYARPVYAAEVKMSSNADTEGIYYKVEQPCPKVQKQQNNFPSTSNSKIKFRLPQYSFAFRESNQSKIKSNVKFAECEELLKNGYKLGTTMYTSPDKLAETIAFQQRLLRQAMVEQANMLKQPNNIDKKKSREASEWKIKRRSDGTRYITKRPTRHRLLKEREEQLNRERVSTDDDAMSELKLGRYWTREERKKHMEKAKERRLRHHQTLAEKCRQPADQMIVQLSHNKMMRRKGQLLFDKFTTVQEFLAHGNRDPSNPLNDGILSVTTV